MCFGEFNSLPKLKVSPVAALSFPTPLKTEASSEQLDVGVFYIAEGVSRWPLLCYAGGCIKPSDITFGDGIVATLLGNHASID